MESEEPEVTTDEAADADTASPSVDGASKKKKKKKKKSASTTDAEAGDDDAAEGGGDGAAPADGEDGGEDEDEGEDAEVLQSWLRFIALLSRPCARYHRVT